MSYMEVGLWKASLGQASGPHQAEVERLRVAYERFREGVRMLAADIARDLPTFTVHDITHIDALWGVADTIAGCDYPLNPLEAFVLGGAFLIHDLGMGLASWPNREKGLQKHHLWRDTVASLLQRSLHRLPSSAEISSPPEHIASQAIAEMLRQLHAEHAERLVDARWSSDEDCSSHVLLEDEPLRFHLGPLIGKIAHSHWWDARRLPLEFTTEVGAPPGFPRDWAISSLKIALLLRVTDAAHIDDRRAPRLLRAARGLDGRSRQHWVFQGHLSQVRANSGQLVFTATRPFGVEEAEAWWLASETLQMVDRELHSASGLLASAGYPQFVAQNVAGVESSAHLVRFLPVTGWEPVQASVRVGDVATLIERIGGVELYGRQPTVPLRELIQNATDAVVARRMLENRDQGWGSVVVSTGRDSHGSWVEVADDGVGMSRVLLTGPLLDFGESYWGSALCREEHRNLAAGGFEPIGRYGIGFFSVFMWGERVRVTSRPYADAQASTRVLEFRTGLRTSPVLRAATRSECLRDGGTVVRVWLKSALEDAGGLLYADSSRKPQDLGALCARLAPSLPVDLYVEEGGVKRQVIRANDWETLPGGDLLERLHKTEAGETHDIVRTVLQAEGARICPIRDDQGRLIGRACIPTAGLPLLSFSPFTHSVVTVGGLTAGSVQGIAGILKGQPSRADRMSGVPIASLPQIGEWATQQARSMRKSRPDEVLHSVVPVINGFGGDTAGLPICRARSGLLTEEQVASTYVNASRVILLPDDWTRRRERSGLELAPEVLMVETSRKILLVGGRGPADERWPRSEDPPAYADGYYWGTLVAVVVRALARAWSVPEADLWKLAQFSAHEERLQAVVGNISGEEIREVVHFLHRPKYPTL